MTVTCPGCGASLELEAGLPPERCPACNSQVRDESDVELVADAIDRLQPELRQHLVLTLVQGYLQGARENDTLAESIGVVLAVHGVAIVLVDGDGAWFRSVEFQDAPAPACALMEAVGAAVTSAVDEHNGFSREAEAG